MKKNEGYKKCPYKQQGKQFTNPYLTNPRRKLIDFFLWQLGYYNDVKKPRKKPKTFSFPNKNEKSSAQKPQITWVNHSTFLVEIGGIRLLTDPIWSKRCSPFNFIGPKRQHEHGVKIDQLPNVDIVLISHDHYDHLDKKTVLYLMSRFPKILWVVPLGLKKWFQKRGASNIIELSWWESSASHQLNFPKISLKVTAVPAQHFSGRGIFKKNRTLWVGYVIEFITKEKELKRLYFVGDTGYNDEDFKAIGKTFKKMDLSLIPIGAYVPKKFMSPVHIGPSKAVQIHQEVHSHLSLGMHWKTFHLSEEGVEQPPYDLYCELRNKRIDPKTFRVINIGQTINW